MPPLTHLLAFAAAAAVIVAIPGPSLLFTIGRALTVGRRDALLTVLGNASGVGLQAVAVALGLGAVVAASAAAYTVVKLAGAAYLVWLGVQAFRHRRALAGELGLDGLAPRVPAWRVWRTGVLVGLTNPKTIVFLGALLPQFVDGSSGSAAVQMLVLAAVFVVVAIAGDSMVALAASRARDWFTTSPERLARVGGTGGLMMVGLGAGLAVSGRPE